MPSMLPITRPARFWAVASQQQSVAKSRHATNNAPQRDLLIINLSIPQSPGAVDSISLNTPIPNQIVLTAAFMNNSRYYNQTQFYGGCSCFIFQAPQVWALH